MTRLCRLCGERPVSPARLKAFDYRCSRCRHQTPGQRATVARYNRSSPVRRAAVTVNNARRIFIGNDYHSRVASAETARLINAHIRKRRHAFITGQSDRKEAEGAAES
jgi:hypothetical protein